MKNVISVKNLSKTYLTYQRKEGFLSAFKSLFVRKYKKVRAVKNINFSVKKGEILGFIGPNGSGKSTTIKMLTGILMPTSGKINSVGFEPFEEREDYVAHIGVVFGQKSQLWWDIPAIDAFYTLKEIYGVPDKEFKERLEYFIKLLDLKEISKTPVRNLSLGQRMRCEFVAAMLHNPEIVLLDEPTIGLDVVAKEKIRDFIREVNKKYKTTFIVTTHDMDDIEELCKRIIMVDKGKIIYDGSLNAVKKKYITSREVEVTFEKKVPKVSKILYGKIKSWTPMKALLEVKTGKGKKTAKLISYLFRKFPVDDVIIREPKIEETIKKMMEDES